MAVRLMEAGSMRRSGRPGRTLLSPVLDKNTQTEPVQLAEHQTLGLWQWKACLQGPKDTEPGMKFTASEPYAGLCKWLGSTDLA